MAPFRLVRGLDSTAVGDEGGFAPAVADPEKVGIDGGKKIVGLKKGSATLMSQEVRING